MQGKSDLYVDKNPANVDKNPANVDKKRQKNGAPKQGGSRGNYEKHEEGGTGGDGEPPEKKNAPSRAAASGG